MKQPPSFVAQGEPRLVCKLQHSLDGLKQCPRAWFGIFNTIIQNFGIKNGEVDYLVFFCHISPDQSIYLVVYVDHVVITQVMTMRRSPT